MKPNILIALINYIFSEIHSSNIAEMPNLWLKTTTNRTKVALSQRISVRCFAFRIRTTLKCISFHIFSNYFWLNFSGYRNYTISRLIHFSDFQKNGPSSATLQAPWTLLCVFGGFSIINETFYLQLKDMVLVFRQLFAGGICSIS